MKPLFGVFDKKTQLCERVNAELIEGDVSVAVRVVASDDTINCPTASHGRSPS